MLERFAQAVRERVERVQAWYEYRQAWETVDERTYYNRVVKQASGYSVPIYKRKVQENQIDGTRRETMETEVDTVWCPYRSTRWRPGRPLEWNGELIGPAENAMIFGDVARGYRR